MFTTTPMYRGFHSKLRCIEVKLTLKRWENSRGIEKIRCIKKFDTSKFDCIIINSIHRSSTVLLSIRTLGFEKKLSFSCESPVHVRFGIVMRRVCARRVVTLSYVFGCDVRTVYSWVYTFRFCTVIKKEFEKKKNPLKMIKRPVTRLSARRTKGTFRLVILAIERIESDILYIYTLYTYILSSRTCCTCRL